VSQCIDYIGSTYIEFDEVEVPITNLLGKENEGFNIIMSSKRVVGTYRRRTKLTKIASRL
jgi:hypothetical protein